ncbi:hypothetical protein LSTR_LSTR006792 [Laodelphax striatellus]|uniref:Ion transport domain-containing protein n=1 Tax=Laodelphax striatellus TaxID=195883 RepID=A0A482WRU0_LAOST|nr:hypothetical protein LSTR_LSTR006792 [Laodelphax striatellus]
MELECFIPPERDSMPAYEVIYQDTSTGRNCDLKIKNLSQRLREHYNSKLLDAARKGDREMCKCLIQEQFNGTADVNSQCRMNGATPLIVATAWGHLQVVEELVNLGADIMIRDFKNRTAVHIAAANGSLEILNILLTESGDPELLELIVNAQITNKVNDLKTNSFDSWVHKHCELLPLQMPDLESGSTALHAASQWSRSRCVELLLAKGADPGLLDDRGLTPLDVAGEKQVVSDLGDRPSSANSLAIGPRSFQISARSPLFSDSSKSDSEEASDAEDKTDSETEDDKSTVALPKIMPMIGDRDKRINNETTGDVIQLLFDKWRKSIENLHAIGDDNNRIMRIRRSGDIKKPVTCLHTVVISGNTELLKNLLFRNDTLEENLHVFDKDGLTPLHRAVIMRRLDIVTTILENGLQHLININDLGGRTLLFLSVEIEWVEGIDYFLNHGAELSLSSQDNSNVLHVAARLGNADLLSELVQFDRGIALVNSMNNKKQTPLWNAVKKCSPACVSLLLAAGAQVSLSLPDHRSLLHLAAENSSPQILRLLLDFGGRSMVSVMYEGMTPLQLASRKGLVDCIKVLVEYGGDVKEKTGVVGDLTSGGTCLHLAARYGHLRVVEYMVQFDKSLLNIPNDDNWYPLHVAARFGKTDCAHFLIVHGADMSVKVVDKAGNINTAIDLIACFIPQPHNFFQRIFDESIETNGHPANHSLYHIRCKYSFLIPSNRDKRQLKALVSLINIDNDHLLEKIILHPVIESFLFLKWQKLKFFFIAVMMLYVTFTISFTALSVAMLEKVRSNQSISSNHSSQQNNTLIILDALISSEVVVMFNKLLTFGSLLIIGPVEIYQALTLRRCYFLKIESWLKATIMVLTVWTLLVHSESNVQTRSSISAVIILCSWSELLFLLACLPNWGFGILMFCKVAQNVIKILVTFSCLIIGFAFAFMVLFQSSEPFVTFWLSLLKVMVMMSEYDYGDLFSGREGHDYLARAIFLAFIILVSIVLMNLMVGIAVSDIALLEDQGRVSRLVKHIDFLDLLEELVYNDVFLKIMPKRAGRSLKMMRAAPSYFTFKPGRPLKNRKISLPPNLQQSMINKVDELNRFNVFARPETNASESKERSKNEIIVDNHEQCKSNCEETALKLQCILEEIAKLKDEFRSLKDQSPIH